MNLSVISEFTFGLMSSQDYSKFVCFILGQEEEEEEEEEEKEVKKEREEEGEELLIWSKDNVTYF